MMRLPGKRRNDREIPSILSSRRGNLKNNTIYVGKVLNYFPNDAIGGPTKQDSADPLTLILHDGPTVLTDIVGPRNMLRDRKWAPWFKRHGARPGDHVVFTPVDETTYFVALARGAQ